MDSSTTTPFVAFLNQFIFGFLGTILIGVLSKIVLQWILTEIGVVKRKIKPDDWFFIKNIVAQGVQFAEQTGLTAEVKKTGAQKFAECLGYVNSALAHTEFKGLDVQILAGLIESSVFDMKGTIVAALDSTSIAVPAKTE